jgi:hypothetical protein
MRLKLSALFLSTALATGFGMGALVLLSPAAPVAMAQDAAQPGEVDVDALLKLVPPQVTATYESKSYDSMSGVTTVKNLKIAKAGDEAANYFQVAEIGLRGLDLAAFDHVFNFNAYGAAPDETFKPLFGDVTVKGVTIVVDGAPAGSIESLNFGGLQMKQLQVKPPGQGGGATEADGIKFAGALLDSIIIGPVDLTNLAIDAQGQKVTLGKLALAGYTRGQYGASSLESFETVAEGNTTKMASATAEGGDISKVLPWMIKAEMPPVAPEPLLYFGPGQVSGLDYDIMGTKVSIASYGIDAMTFYWLVPSSLKFTLNDMVIVPGGPMGNPLGEIGLERLDIDFGLDWAFDGDAGTAKLKELRISESQLADAVLAVDLSSINLAQLVNPDTMQGAAMTIGLGFAQLYLKNNGGFQKLLDVQAKQMGSTPDAVRQQALDQLTALEGGIPGPSGEPTPPSERVKGIIASLKAFITSPGTLTIKVQPATPVNAMSGMGAMMDPMGAADTLGVTVEATPQ